MAAPQRKVVTLKPAAANTAALPESLKVGPYHYTVRPMDDLERATTGNIGFCDDEMLEIGVAEGMSGPHKAETMIHEILHACFEVGSLRAEPGLEEEKVVTVLAKQFLGVLVDNPGLIAWLAANHPGIKVS